MQITGKVVQVAIDVDVKKAEKNGGGSYKGWKLVYEDGEGEVKTIAKHMNSLKFAAPLANGLKQLNAGDMFTMEMEKEGDFWNPKSVFKGEASPTKTQSIASKHTNTTTSSNSTYATKEERAQTQKYIVRQSSVTSALKLLEVTGVKKATTSDVIVLAKEFEAFVMGTIPVIDKQETSDDFSDLEDDIPF